MTSSDTICALATPAGGAIGIIRLSGPRALDITDKVFKRNGSTLSQICLKDAKPNTIHYGVLHDMDGHDIDDVVVLVFKSPHSYTGEDATEICCHGSQYILQQVLHTLIVAGARQAEPGEYTKRAYLNGKLDLSQAEAVADLISASNRATHQMALSQLKGHFSSELSKLREQLLKMTSLLELELDFSDHEELEFADRGELKELAINIDGTTRDVIEDTTNIKGVTFRFIDTAGIRETQDTIEKLGIQKAFQKLEEAAIVLWLLDANPTQQELEDITSRCIGKTLLTVINKIDKISDKLHTDNPTSEIGESDIKQYKSSMSSSFNGIKTLNPIFISAKLGLGIEELEDCIYQAADIPEINENSVIITSARHYEALSRAHESIQQVIIGLTSDISGDLLAEDLRICLSELADITGGQITPQETLNNIFSHFCIGK